jgi:hypothetical protein
VEAVVRQKEEEAKNQDKLTKVLSQEQERLQKRLEKLSDPKYPAELKRKQAELDSRLKTLTKEQRQCQYDQTRREKKLEKMIGSEEPEVQKDCTLAQNALTALVDKETKVEAAYK